MTIRLIKRVGLMIGAAALLAPAFLALTPTGAEAQVVLSACYVPNTGIVYRIKAPDTRAECRATRHVKFSWTDANGAVFEGDAAGGDLGGTYPDPTVAKLQGNAVAATGEPSPGQVLTWDGTSWTPTPSGVAVSDHGALTGLADDDHTQYVLADGVRSTTDGFAVTGALFTGSIPVSGAGVRIMWYPRKAAFRVGRAISTEWDDANIGNQSVAMGVETTASGFGSVAMGVNTTASGASSTAMGNGTTASAGASTAMGVLTTASGTNSTAMGNGTTASGLVSTAMGFQTTAGNSSTAMGNGTTASGDRSTAMGFTTTASGINSTAMGHSTTAIGNQSTAMGEQTQAIGDNSTAMGQFTTASGPRSTAMGENTTASGLVSTAMGNNTEASGDQSVAMGDGTTASGPNSTAMGALTTASGAGSTAMGDATTASGDRSTAMGVNASTNGKPGSFVYGDNSTTSIVNVTAANSFVVRATGGTTFFSSSNLMSGVSLAPGGNAWAMVSDRNRKENFWDEDGEAVLTKIAALPIQSWNYKSQAPTIRHMGPTAQDFYAAFGLGEGELTITTTDIDGVNLLAVQALEKRTAALQAENARLRERLTKLEAMVRSLIGAESN